MYVNMYNMYYTFNVMSTWSLGLARCPTDEGFWTFQTPKRPLSAKTALRTPGVTVPRSNAMACRLVEPHPGQCGRFAA